MPHHSYRITPSASLNAETHVILENHDVLHTVPSKSLPGGFIHPYPVMILPYWETYCLCRFFTAVTDVHSCYA
eukprot:6451289-Prymnesium_polylepis.1